jgi:hypothetical protein
MRSSGEAALICDCNQMVEMTEFQGGAPNDSFIYYAAECYRQKFSHRTVVAAEGLIYGRSPEMERASKAQNLKATHPGWLALWHFNA